MRNKDGITVAVLFALAATGDFVTSAVGAAGWPSKSTLTANDGRQLMVWRNADPSLRQRPSEKASTSLSRLTNHERTVYVRHEGADDQWRKVPPGDLLVSSGS